ncbi:hypothetical protein BDP55DRAFT_771824 [Colletotrichum godetiae]|uniref:Uncharacterized protein n=1 Tax=Colletotrichum godetiae TaxID=1209918 RepID=A0AAJ0ETK3_9PEZI|nr:uncharacterized protein BDP55DRAFT_771824 [Colletotrichum godetiae]KAK1671334.1 hypothetical protein BDP55DRAFT_771824 [Colletotrichum godetiae]
MTDANIRDPSLRSSAPQLPLTGRNSVPREKPWSERFPSKDFQDYQRQTALRLAKAQEAGIQLCDIYFDAAWGLPWWEGMEKVDLKPGEGQNLVELSGDGQKLVRLSGNGESSYGSNKRAKTVPHEHLKALKELVDKKRVKTKLEGAEDIITQKPAIPGPEPGNDQDSANEAAASHQAIQDGLLSEYENRGEESMRKMDNKLLKTKLEKDEGAISKESEMPGSDPSNNDDPINGAVAPAHIYGDNFYNEHMAVFFPTDRESYDKLADIVMKKPEPDYLWMGGPDYKKYLERARPIQ